MRLGCELTRPVGTAELNGGVGGIEDGAAVGVKRELIDGGDRSEREQCKKGKYDGEKGEHVEGRRAMEEGR